MRNEGGGKREGVDCGASACTGSGSRARTQRHIDIDMYIISAFRQGLVSAGDVYRS
jgi:hypothetical protein